MCCYADRYHWQVEKISSSFSNTLITNYWIVAGMIWEPAGFRVITELMGNLKQRTFHSANSCVFQQLYCASRTRPGGGGSFYRSLDRGEEQWSACSSSNRIITDTVTNWEILNTASAVVPLVLMKNNDLKLYPLAPHASHHLILGEDKVCGSREREQRGDTLA